MTDGPQFLVAPEPEPGEEEDLAAGPEPSRNRLRRRLGLGAVVLAGALLVARALDTHDTASHEAASHDSARTASAAPPSYTVPVVALPASAGPEAVRSALSRAQQPAQQFAAQLAAHCPPATSCAGSDALPQAFLDAVRDDLGTALPSRQLEVIVPATGTVQYRQLVADGAGGMRITLTVTRTGEIADGSVEGDVNGGKARVYTVVAGEGARYRVELDLDGPPDEVPPFQVLQALVTDPRLL